MDIKKKLDILEWMEIYYKDRTSFEDNGLTQKELETFVNELKQAINYTYCCKSDSEQLVLFADWLQYNGKWSTTKQQVKDFLKEQQ